MDKKIYFLDLHDYIQVILLLKKGAPMKSGNSFQNIISILLLTFFLSCGINQTIQIPPPPVTTVNTVIDTLHNVEIPDDYRWLEDQESKETRDWIDTQNNYTRSILDQLPQNDELTNRLNELINIDYISTPSVRNGKYFYYKRNAGQDLKIIYYRETADSPEQILIDPHTLSEDHSINTNIIDISTDGSILVYGVRQGGEDQQEIHLFDVKSKTDLKDILPRASYFGSIVITVDNKGLYYMVHTSEAGPRVYYHKIGDDQTNDKIIFGKKFTSEMFISPDISEDGKYLLLTVSLGADGKQTEVYYKNLKKNSPIKSLTKGIKARFTPTAVGSTVFLKTDWKAPNGKILKADLMKPASKNWIEIIPASDLVLKSFSLSDGNICVNYLDSVKSKVSIFTPEGQFITDIAFPNIGSVSSIKGRWDNPEAFYSFDSFNMPKTIYKYNHKSKEAVVWHKSELNINSDDFEVKQVWFKSKDGTKVPMFITHKKGIELNNQNPTLMYGYGGFRSTMTPFFSSTYLTWMEQGGIFVVVNLRGGSEFGEAWHEAATFERKQNTFDDFISAGEWLIANKYTSSENLAIRGGSNGGLLVGACLVQRPDLFKAVICTWPLLDMIRYHQFLVGRFWISEYGSADEPDQFEYIKKYSPYHNVVKGTEYPAVFLITGDRDTRVDPCHARKMAALLQANNGSENPIMLRYETKAGHSGGIPMTKKIQNIGDELRFLLWQLKG